MIRSAESVELKTQKNLIFSADGEAMANWFGPGWIYDQLSLTHHERQRLRHTQAFALWPERTPGDKVHINMRALHAGVFRTKIKRAAIITPALFTEISVNDLAISDETVCTIAESRALRRQVDETIKQCKIPEIGRRVHTPPEFESPPSKFRQLV